MSKNNIKIDPIRPEYYDTSSAYEPLKVIDAWGLGFRLGSVLKYVARAGKKPGVACLEDLVKAKTYLELEIDRQVTLALIKANLTSENK